MFGSGLFNGTADFDPSADTHLLQTQGHYDIPLYQLDAAGRLLWAGQVGGADWDSAYDLTLDAAGHLVGVGGFKGVADFDSTVGQLLLTSAGGFDAVIFQLGSGGSAIAADQFGGPGDDLAYGVHVGPRGSIFATGYFSETADFDPGPGQLLLTSQGGQDAFLVKLTANRAPLGLALSNQTALETGTAGTLVGYFSTNDPNPEDSFSYTLVPGSGDTDNAAFQIAGRKLRLSDQFGGKSAYSIRVRTTDRDGQWLEASFTIAVSATVDIPPEVASVVRIDNEFSNAQTVRYTVTFTEPVTGVTTDDFSLVTSGVTGATVTDVSGVDAVYTVTVDTGSGDGTVRLDVQDDDTILDAASQPLGGVGVDNGRFVPGVAYVLDKTPPQVVSIERVGSSPTNAATVLFAVTFSEGVVEVDAADFALNVTGTLTGVSINSVVGTGTSYLVSVYTGTGDGTLRLDVVDNDSVTDAAGNALGGAGTSNGDFTSGPVYELDRSPPVVQSIVRVGGSPTDAAEVAFQVTFSEPVTGVDVSDFALAQPTLPGAAVMSVTGAAESWLVTVGSGWGDGQIRLDVVDDDSIQDAAGNPLGATGLGNGDYSGGETYVIDRTGVIHGRKWDDRDRDGYWDPLEPGLAGVTIYLDMNDNSVWDAGEPTAITVEDDPGTIDVDETGQYRFEDVGPGSYAVLEITPPGWEPTFPFSRSGATGQLTLSEVIWDNQNGVDGLDEAAGVAVSPDGNHIYVASYIDNTLTVFQRDSQTGRATWLQMAKHGVGGVSGLAGAQSVALSPDGQHVYVASYFSSAIAVFERDLATGLVTYVQQQQDGVNGVDGLYRAVSVALSPDGKHVYGVGVDDNAVAVFSRDPNTGSLSFVQTVKDGVGGVDGLAGAFSVAISPDGAHAYVGGSTDDALAAFSRDANTGTLTFIEREKDGVGGVNGLNGASGVVLSPDGNHVYVAGYHDDRIAVFRRDANSGAITYVQSLYSSTTLNGIISASISPDGSHLYTASELSDTVNVYRRSSSTGALTYVQSFQDGSGGVDGLNGVWWTTVSPDGLNLYAVGAYDDTLVVFDRNAGTWQLEQHQITIGSNETVGPLDFANANDPPQVIAIQRLDPDPTQQALVRFLVTFDEPVTGVDTSDLSLGPGAPGGAVVTQVTGDGVSYSVTVDTGSGDGIVRLDVLDDDTILDLGNKPLGGTGVGNGDFTAGEFYTIDKTAPVVASIVRADSNPTDQQLVRFTVTFSEAVTGVDAGDFLPATSGLTGVGVIEVSGTGDSYLVTVDAGSGAGTLRLDLVDDDSILDTVALPLGGVGLGNGDFTAGETYTILADSAEIQGIHWNDLNRDGVQDAGEPGLPGRRIYLDLDQNGRYDAGEPSTTTDVSGSYALTGLASGTYTVADDLLPGWKQTFPAFDPHHIERFSLDELGQQSDSYSYSPSLSGNATFAAFVTCATNLVPNDTNGYCDVLVRDMRSGSLERISMGHDGSEANGHSRQPSITPDGRLVVFVSEATNLVPGDTNSVQDVFVYDRQTGQTERVNLAFDGAESNATSDRPSLSTDGRYVVFDSTATNLVSWRHERHDGRVPLRPTT